MNYEILGTGSTGNCIEEIWKPIKDFEDKYEISNLGRVKNKITNHIFKNTNQYGNYFSMVLYDGEKKKSVKIHRLVAQAFIPNPQNLQEVNHKKDYEKDNNRVDNLEWVTSKENCNYGNRNKKIANKLSKKINQYDLDGNFIKTWRNITEASKYYNINISTIVLCLKGT